MRPIDASNLLERLCATLDASDTEYDQEAVSMLVQLVTLSPTVRPAPALPPNDPLTLEELRDMDGEPVWVERPGYGKGWALVEVWAKSTNIIYLLQSNGSVLQPQVELDCGGRIYRRRLEEE